jgi:23S rRNA (pseudouridine1915-N3)-methyltransferase
MLKVKIITVGKTKEHWLQEALEEYTERLKPHLLVEWSLVKNDDQLKQFLFKEPSFLALDPKGKGMTSEEFSRFLMRQFEANHSRITVAIGGAEGLSSEIRQKASALISFSSLTFTHQITRLILLEQLYRAFEIEKGSQYHK